MHHDPSAKRRQMALRFFTYGVMTVAVAILSILSILFVLGYRFDQTSGKVEQQALLQLRSYPSDATVLLDGRQLSFRTPGKYTLAAGQHAVSMQLDGYHTWSKEVTMQAGSLLWLNYTRFIPTSVNTEELQALPGLTSMKASPDRRWLAFGAKDDGKLKLSLADVSNEDAPKYSELAIPAEIIKIKGKTGKLTIDEWDFGGRYLLVRHTVGATTEFIQVDRTDPAAARNISRQLKVAISKAHFAGTSGSALFALSDGDVRKINLEAGTISRPLVSNVHDFTLYKSDTIAYTALEGVVQQAGIYKDGEKEPIVVRTFKGAKPTAQVDVTSYFGDTYLAVAHGKKVEIIKDPTNTGDAAGRVFAAFTFAPEARWLHFSSNGRFIVAQHGANFATYDLEEDILSRAKIGTKSDYRFEWLDDYYLASSHSGQLRLSEFDGTNQHDITRAAVGFAASLSDNGEQLFTIGKKADGEMILQRSRMVLR